MAIVYMTEEGYKKMLEEITFLETVKRPEISRQIAEARDKGDLSENAEYDAAKEAQGLLEMKIAQLKDKVANARMIDDTKLNTHTVQILNKVKIKNTKNNAVMQYMLVSESEANLKEGKIAVSTPIGKGLLGKKVGDIAEIQVPSGRTVQQRHHHAEGHRNSRSIGNRRGFRQGTDVETERGDAFLCQSLGKEFQRIVRPVLSAPESLHST